MDREPKYRAYDKHDKVMRDVTILYLDEGLGYFASLDDGSSPSNPKYHLPGERFSEPMQSIGLHDKHKQEIYDRDILMGADKTPMVIEWHFNRWIYRVKGRVRELNRLDFEAGFFEIVGNIYEGMKQ